MRLFAVAALSAVTVVAGISALYAPAYAQGPTKSIWDGVYTADQADKGKALFQENCSKCHGVTLDGNDEIPALKGSHFMADWESQTVTDLINRVHTTMPMDDPGKLSTPSATLVVAFLLQQNGMPAGSAELTEGTAATARIDAVKPAGK
jgi:mono/diheme cytochrome c family protein